MLKIVRTTSGYSEGKAYMDKYHSYIKYSPRPSRLLYWDLYEDDVLVGTFALGSAFAFANVVQQFMAKYNCEFNELANNIVYCIGPHKDKNAGTKFLRLCREDAIQWWYEKYGYVLKCFQTYIEPPRNGTVYKADNWQYLGLTTGYTWTTIDYNDVPQAAITATGTSQKKIDGVIYQMRTMKDGTHLYMKRSFNEEKRKLIYMKATSEKEQRKAIAVVNAKIKINDEQNNKFFNII